MKSDTFISLAVGLFLSALITSSASASWDPDKRLSYNTGRSGLSAGNAHCVATDSAGTVHIVWHDDTPGNYEIQYVVVDSLSVWPPSPRRLTTNPGSSRDPSIAVMPDTTVCVVWTDDSGRAAPAVFFARFHPHGSAFIDSTVASTGALACSGPCVAVAGDGSVHVVWTQNTGQVSDIFYRKWDNGWVDDPLNISISLGTCVSASVAVDGLGNVHVVWADNVSTNYEIYHRKYSPVSGWSSIFKVSRSGVLAWSPSVGADKNGNVFVVWADKRDENFEIYFRRYIDGIGWGNEKRLSYNPGISTNPCVSVDCEGNVHIVWEDFRTGNDEIYYRRISNREGPGWDPLETRLTNDAATSWNPSVSADCSGNVHVIWADNRDLNFEIYYKFGLKPVPVSVDLVAFYAECTTDGVVLRWEVSADGSVAFFDVYRKEENGGSLVKLTPQSLFAKNEFLDTGVNAGVKYEYFLGISEGEDQTLFGPASVTCLPPLAINPSTLAVWPNPSTGPIKVAFAADRDNVRFRLTLVDVGGRVVGETVSGVASAGVTSFSWDPVGIPGRSLSAGVYFVLLEMDGRRLEKKIVFMK